MQFTEQFYNWVEENKLDLEELSDDEVLKYFLVYVKDQSATLLEYYKKRPQTLSTITN